MSTCNQLDLETLGSWPLMPKFASEKTYPLEFQVLYFSHIILWWQQTHFEITFLRLQSFKLGSFKHVCESFPSNLQAKYSHGWVAERIDGGGWNFQSTRALVRFTTGNSTLAKVKFCVQSHHFVYDRGQKLVPFQDYVILIGDPSSMCVDIFLQICKQKDSHGGGWDDGGVKFPQHEGLPDLQAKRQPSRSSSFVSNHISLWDEKLYHFEISDFNSRSSKHVCKSYLQICKWDDSHVLSGWDDGHTPWWSSRQ